jgi:hypothetical protein
VEEANFSNNVTAGEIFYVLFDEQDKYEQEPKTN